MLKKLLPSIFDRRKNLSQSQQEKQENLKESKGSFSTDFNLVSKPEEPPVHIKLAIKLVSYLRRFIIFTSSIFGVLLILNFSVSYIINYQKNLQDTYMHEIRNYEGVEIKAKEIDAKTVAYKKFLNDRKEVSSKLNFVLENVGTDVKYSSLILNQSSFKISTEGKLPVYFTYLITRYLEAGEVSEIIISSASLDKTSNNFKVDMEGIFK